MANYTRDFLAGDRAARPALKLGDSVLTFAALDESVGRAAGLLRGLGVGPGDRVGLQLPNGMAFPIVFLAVLRLGAVVVPMNPLLKEREVAYQLSDSGARVTVAGHESEEAATSAANEVGAMCFVVRPESFDAALGFGEPVREVTERRGGDAAMIIYTSGTTGSPKGAALTHAGLAAMLDTASELVGFDEGSISLAALPLFHIFGMQYLNGTLRAGGLTTLMARFDAEQALSVMARDRVTIFAGVPTMFTALLSVPEPSRFDLASLTVCVSGGASLPLEVLRSFEEEFGASILEGYGLTETSALGAFNPRDRRKAGSVGLPVGGAEIRIVDKDGMDVSPGTRGELVLRAPFLTPGYWQRPEATAEAMRGGWFHTGDIATADEDGYLYIVDRMKDLIIRGGYNVYPREIEEVLYEHPGVREAAVIGFAHPLLGEEIAAVVVLNGDVRVTGDELREYVKERVAAYKYPRRVAIVDELPKGPTGKILKRLIELPEPRQADTGGVSA